MPVRTSKNLLRKKSFWNCLSKSSRIGASEKITCRDLVMKINLAAFGLAFLLLLTLSSFGQSNSISDPGLTNRKYIAVKSNEIRGKVPHAGETFHRIDTAR